MFPQKYIKIDTIVGKVLDNVQVFGDEIIFHCSDGEKYKLFHNQDCCESVYIEDIVGDMGDIIGVPIIEAREDVSNENPEGITKEYQDSFTWTFYNISTVKGYVSIRWYGESNGYYSESVDFCKI